LKDLACEKKRLVTICASTSLPLLDNGSLDKDTQLSTRELSPMPWESFYEICDKSDVYRSIVRIASKFFVSLIVVVTITGVIVLVGIGSNSSFLPVISTILPLLPLLLNKFIGLDDLWKNWLYDYNVFSNTLLLQKKKHEEEVGKTFILLLREVQNLDYEKMLFSPLSSRKSINTSELDNVLTDDSSSTLLV
jgi:hypothetical protein